MLFFLPLSTQQQLEKNLKIAKKEKPLENSAWNEFMCINVLFHYKKKKTKKTSEFIVWPIYLFIYSSVKGLGRRTFSCGYILILML